MSKEDLLEGLRDLERRERPGTAAAQLRTIGPEIDDLLASGYTQRQIWAALTERGLKVSFSGFKTCLNRMQKEVNESQKVSKRFDWCPHCGGALARCEVGGKDGEAVEPLATSSQQAVSTEAEPSDVSAPNEDMGSMFARRLESGALNGGLLPKQWIARTK